MRKAYLVSYEVELLFTADPENEDPRDVAEASLKEALEFADIEAEECEPKLAAFLPRGWSGLDLAYGTHEGDMTAREALNLNRQ